MEACVGTKRPPDADSPSTSDADTKRRLHPPAPPPFSAGTTPSPTSSFKPSFPSATLFRLLCPASRTGALIGKGGSIIRHLRDLTGAKIYVDDPVPSCDERVIVIVPERQKPAENLSDKEPDSHEPKNVGSSNPVGDWDESSPAQLALLKAFERLVREDEREEDREKEKEDSSWSSSGLHNDFGETKGPVVCRLLAPSHQVGCVLGKGGKIVEKIRQESGAYIRVLPKEHIPPCASPGDELIQMTGNLLAVKKALMSVSSCLQENARIDATNTSATKPLGVSNDFIGRVDPPAQRGYPSGPHAPDYHFRERDHFSHPMPENIGSCHRMGLEEDVVFKLLCQADKAGSLIGKGGSVVRALQNETGASIKVYDSPSDPDERVVWISARESCDENYSPAQEAVIRVNSRIAEIGFEPGAPVVSRLLVHPQQIGCLLGRGGVIVTEMRRATGANIRIFPREQMSKGGYQNDEIVQVTGSFQSVQDALFHITGRLRETIFPMRPPPSNFPPHFSSGREAPPPYFRQRHNPPSPGHYPSPAGPPRGMDRSAGQTQPIDYRPPYPHGMDPSGCHADRVPYPYGTERPVPAPPYDRPPSPGSYASQAGNGGTPRGPADPCFSLPSRGGHFGSGGQAPSSSIEIVIPQTLLSHVNGENHSNLTHIRQISGAEVLVFDPMPGKCEGRVVVSGTQDRIHAAQSLIHAFILCGQTP